MIRNIWAVGRNYVLHAQEMGAKALPDSSPLIFLKAGSCVVEEPRELRLPKWAQEVHYETEMAVILDADLAPGAVAVALDLTERKLQSEAKKSGLPWTSAKSFIGACPLGSIYHLEPKINLEELAIELWVNGEIKQKGHTSDMIHSVSKIVAHLKDHYPLCPGDLILTGTPEGVGPLNKGDHVEAKLGQISSMTFTVSML